MKYSVVRLINAVFVFLLFGTISQSCRKEYSIVSRNHVVRDRFFDHTSQVNNVILRVIDEVKARERKNEFVENFAVNNGFPKWEKAIVTYPESLSEMNNSIASLNFSDPIIDTFAYIPLVIEGSEVVNGFILAKISNGVELLYSLAKDYKAFSFENGSTLNDATKFVLTNLILNKEVFGVSDYKITDYNLFTSNPESERAIAINISHELGAGQCILVTWSNQVCTTNCQVTTSSIEVCTAHSTVNWPEGGIGVFSNGGISTGIGGGGGSGIPHYYPCTAGTTSSTPGLPPSCPEPGAGSGWVPHVVVNSQIIPCEILEQAAKKLDSLYTRAKVDSMLTRFPQNWQTDSIEYGFPIYKKYQGVANQPGQYLVTGYSPGYIQIGGVGFIEITWDIMYLSTNAGSVHLHTPNGYSAQSAGDIYQLIESYLSSDRRDAKLEYEGNFVLSANGDQYAVSITNAENAAAFFNTKNQYLDRDKWRDGSIISKAFKDASDYFETKVFKGDANKKNLAYEMAMSAVLGQFNTGVSLFKKGNTTSNFKPIVVNTITPEPDKPKKKKYNVDCQ